MEDENEYIIDIVEMLIQGITEDSEMKIRIKNYMQCHKSRCNDYLYTSGKFKESARIFTHIYKNLLSDMCKDICNVLDKQDRMNAVEE